MAKKKAEEKKASRKVNEEVKDQQENVEVDANENIEEKEESAVDENTSEKENNKEEEEKVEVKEVNVDFKDKYMRLSAEFDNYRKRTLKERMELTKTAGESILKDILPVVDDLERALQSIEQAKEIDAVKGGIELINNKFQEFLKQKGLKEIESLHQEFDTDKHEALTKIPAPEEKLKGKIVDVVQKGYILNEKVIRFSKVVIGE